MKLSFVMTTLDAGYCIHHRASSIASELSRHDRKAEARWAKQTMTRVSLPFFFSQNRPTLTSPTRASCIHTQSTPWFSFTKSIMQLNPVFHRAHSHSPSVSSSLLAFILLAGGYDDDWLDTLMTLLDQEHRGIDYVKVCLTSGVMKSSSGKRSNGDYTLSQVEGIVPHLIILPAGQYALRKLFIVPHVHSLLSNTIHSGGYIALSPEAEFYMRRSKITRFDPAYGANIIHQRSRTLEEFAQSIRKI